jgi:hypothetical protein
MKWKWRRSYAALAELLIELDMGGPKTIIYMAFCGCFGRAGDETQETGAQRSDY